MSDSVRPVMFGGTHVKKAINDDEFFEKLPQFKPIRAKIAAMHANLKNPKGCSSCQQRRVQLNVEQDFAAIASALDPASGKIFKDYFGAKRMVIHAVNPVTRAAYLKDI